MVRGLFAAMFLGFLSFSCKTTLRVREPSQVESRAQSPAIGNEAGTDADGQAVNEQPSPAVDGLVFKHGKIAGARGELSSEITLKFPENIRHGTLGLEITTASTGLLGLTDIFFALLYPTYPSNEHLASRVLAVGLLSDVLEYFEAAGIPDADALRDLVNRDIEKLVGNQADNGGFGFWLDSGPTEPYLSIHVAHCLVVAANRGWPVPKKNLEKVLAYIEQFTENHEPRDDADMSPAIAYGLYVLHLVGRFQPETVLRLLQTIPKGCLTIESTAWLLPVLHAGADRDRVNDLIKSLTVQIAGPDAQHVLPDDTCLASPKSTLLSSKVRATAAMLYGLVHTDPRNKHIIKLLRGLTELRQNGRYATSQDNIFALWALEHYLASSEEPPSRFRSRVYLNNSLLAEKYFEGRSIKPSHLHLNHEQLATISSPPPIVLERDGEGILYYRVAIIYQPSNHVHLSGKNGFQLKAGTKVNVVSAAKTIDPATISWSIEEEDNVPLDYHPGPPRKIQTLMLSPDGAPFYLESFMLSWVKSGGRVRLGYQIVAPETRNRVAFSVHLPSGFALLKLSEPNGDFDGYYYDNGRLVVYFENLTAGNHLLLLESPAPKTGQVLIPPARVEEIYRPDNFALSPTVIFAVNNESVSPSAGSSAK